MDLSSAAAPSAVESAGFANPHNPWRFCVAPMMDWTDRHCRFFHRLLTRHTRMYTEMVTTGALRHGDVPRHLRFDKAEHPVALQIGGSDVPLLANAAELGAQYGYDELNLNCGCPSDRVQDGGFGACLMMGPKQVAQGVSAMMKASGLPVIATDVGGIHEVIDAPWKGKLVPSGNEAALTAALNEALSHPLDRQRIATYGQDLSWQNAAQAYDAILRGAAAPK